MPQGAFYLMVKSPVEDAAEFCQAAKKYNILMVNGASFMAPGYVRLAYCVSYETITNSMEGFRKLAADFDLQQRTFKSKIVIICERMIEFD